MGRLLGAVTLSMLGCVGQQHRAAAAAAAGFKQDVFAIGSFLDPPATDAHYARFKAANFSVMLSTYTTNASTMASQAALCEEHGLKCILSGPTSQFPRGGAGPSGDPVRAALGRLSALSVSL
jgi:hypothetical protein